MTRASDIGVHPPSEVVVIEALHRTLYPGHAVITMFCPRCREPQCLRCVTCGQPLAFYDGKDCG